MFLLRSSFYNSNETILKFSRTDQFPARPLLTSTQLSHCSLIYSFLQLQWFILLPLTSLSSTKPQGKYMAPYCLLTLEPSRHLPAQSQQKKHKNKVWNMFELKVYIRYKTITSQNMSSEEQIKNFFYFGEKLCPILKIFKFLYF